MSDIAITVANVLKGPGGQGNIGVAGTTITAGQALYMDTQNGNVMKLADANGASPANTIAGISLHAALAGQPIAYGTTDTAFQFGGTILSGDPVYLSMNPGGLTATFADLTSGATVIVVGIAMSTTTINLRPLVGGVLA